jgi:hypothetical protein
MFMEAMQQPGLLSSLKPKLQQYNKQNEVKIFDGLFIDATPVQIDTCRLAALMIEPQMFQFLAEKSDPPQDRLAADNPNLRAQHLAQAAIQELQRLHNDPVFVPAHNACVALYAPDIFISTAHCAEQRDYAWIATTFREIKTQMGLLMSRFNSSGNLDNDQGDAARDIIFWNQFCKQQPLWMYIYLLWDHGREACLAWNTILLPVTQTIDIGVDDVQNAPPSASKVTVSSSRKHKRSKIHDEHAVEQLVHVSQELLQRMPAAPSSVSTGSTFSTDGSDTQRAVAMSNHAAALSNHADVLKKQLKELPEECSGVREHLSSSLLKVLQQLCDLTSKQV